MEQSKHGHMDSRGSGEGGGEEGVWKHRSPSDGSMPPAQLPAAAGHGGHVWWGLPGTICAR